MKTGEVRVLQSIRDVDPGQWDAVGGESVYTCYGWLRTYERCSRHPTDPRYVLLADEDRLLGAAVGRIEQPGGKEENLDNLMFGRLWRTMRSVGISFLPALVCCPPGGFGSPLLPAPGLDPARRADVLHELLEAVEAEAERQGLSVAFMEVTADDTELIGLLRAAGYRFSRYLPLCRLNVVWPNFESYVNDLATTVSKHARSHFRYERKRNRAAGVTIERVRDVGGEGERLWELMEATHLKNGDVGFPFRPDFFGEVQANLGEDVVVNGAWKGGELTGAGLLIRRGKRVWGDYIGFDYEASRKDFTYFNLAFHEPVEYALANGIKTIYYGRGQYQLKQRRGCTLCDTFVFYKTRNKIKKPLVSLWCAAHGKYFQRKRLR